MTPKIQVSILLGTVYRKSDPRKLWKTLKNSEYSNFHTLRVIHRICQCPQSGKSHYLPTATRLSSFAMSVSMPLIGRHSFLQEKCQYRMRETMSVSMPLIGRYSFLPCLSGTGLFSSFPGSFLQAFFRIF